MLKICYLNEETWSSQLFRKTHSIELYDSYPLDANEQNMITQAHRLLTTGRSSTPNVEGLPDWVDLPDQVIPDVDSCTGNDTVLFTAYCRNGGVGVGVWVWGWAGGWVGVGVWGWGVGGGGGGVGGGGGGMGGWGGEVHFSLSKQD